ncbi:hypothetical protein [Actinomadura opuntiae]|uniref:hypothetical protein n=1 Tax=Actinomadura sp. OS1-43 TaxID=604315 RepID=UPI00255AE12F|nr:hypothetical protein [Actinomadura sp. OS1-43]MDL4813293.1 hypothetical protein [Actinomadura sp. OS1-43]
MNNTTEPNEPDDVPEPALDARPDLETMPLTETSGVETPALGTEQVPWGGRELVESVYGPLTDHYERLQAGSAGDGPGWSAQIAALRALRTGHVAGDWETLARLLVAPGSLEATDAVRLVRMENEPETVRALVNDLKAAGERTLLLTSTPEQAAALLETTEDLFTLLVETQPPAPDEPLPQNDEAPASVPIPPGDETLKLPTIPDDATAVQPIVQDPPAAAETAPPEPQTQFREDFGSHGTVEFKPVTGLPDPGAAPTPPPDATRADPLPAASAADPTRAEPPIAGTGETPQDVPTAEAAAQYAAPRLETAADATLPAPAAPAPGAGQDLTNTQASASAADVTMPDPAGDIPGAGDVPVGEGGAPWVEQLAAETGSAQGDALGAESVAGAGRVEAPRGPAGNEPGASRGVAMPQDVPAGEGVAPPVAPLGESGAGATLAGPVGATGAADQPGGPGYADPAGVTPVRPPGWADAASGGEAGIDYTLAEAGGSAAGETLPGGRAGADVQGPESWVRGAVLRPVGEAWTRSWREEAGLLRRGLMWLEQWPRDAEALAAVRAEGVARKEALDAELAGLAQAIEEARGAAQTAEQRAVEAEAEAERLVAVQREAEAELAGPRAEAERLQAAADAAGAEAGELTRVADEAFARCTQLDERARNAQHELQGAQQVEASLKDELARAQEALPAAAEEADRLAAVDADASAEGHAAYYRLVSAESALAAVRRKMSVAQRLHVAAPPSDFKSVRAEVRARTREADEAAKRAQEAKDAAERAEAHRQGLAGFVSEGGARLATAREAQERLTTELAWLATERETAGAEHQERARHAAEAVDRATQAGLEARAAHQAARVIEERVEAAVAAREGALAAAQQARSDADAATAREAEVRAALERRAADGERETAAHAVELESAAEAEARSRENVREICGADPAEDPETVAQHQRLAMARIEELGGLLEGGEADGAALLPRADVVVGTPLGVGAALADERFDALVAVGGLADAEFLVGAVRTRRWFLVGPPVGEAPEGEGRGTFERSAVAAPHLLVDGS